jgi:L-ascorbate metabolism protein UlaG (beta-lactamase superfamily)
MATVVADPYDSKAVGYTALKLKADIVTVSHDAPGHNHAQAVRGASHVITGPGEFEIGSVFITGVQTDGAAKSKKGRERLRNTLYVFDYAGITVAHLGDLRAVPSQAQIEALGAVNVALVPVGGAGGLTASTAAEVVSLLEPNIVVPMHYATPDATVTLQSLGRFLKEMGLGKQESQSSLKVSRSGLPDETHVVVLDYRSE